MKAEHNHPPELELLLAKEVCQNFQAQFERRTSPWSFLLFVSFAGDECDPSRITVLLPGPLPFLGSVAEGEVRAPEAERGQGRGGACPFIGLLFEMLKVLK